MRRGLRALGMLFDAICAVVFLVGGVLSLASGVLVVTGVASPAPPRALLWAVVGQVLLIMARNAAERAQDA